MKSQAALRCASIVAAAFIVGGCSAQQSNLVAPPVAAANASAIVRHDGKPTKEWVFVSDPGTSSVYVYDLPKLQLVQIVTGFTQPQGECSDNKGDVWVTDGSGKTIVELLHSGKIVGHLADAYGVPESCAWDARTGNLAVTNLLGANSTSGDVLVYHKATGTPNVYTNSKQFYYDFAGYDSSGNLFLDGRTDQGKFVLSELAVNASQVKSLSLSGGGIFNPGMVEWDAAKKVLVVGDQNCDNQQASCVYQMTIASNVATITYKTALRDGSGNTLCDMIQGTLWHSSIVGSDFNFCNSGVSATYVWPYPYGGHPNHSNSRDDSEPFGAAISVDAGDTR